MYGMEVPDEPPTEGSTITVTWAHRNGENYDYTGEVATTDETPAGYRVILNGKLSRLIADSDELAVYVHELGDDEPDRVGVLTSIAMADPGDGDPEGVAVFLNAGDVECRQCGTTGRFGVEDGRAVCSRCGLAPDESLGEKQDRETEGGA